MRDQLEALRMAATAEISAAGDGAALEALETTYLGRKGALTNLLKGLGSVSAEERPALGNLANEIKRELELLVSRRRQDLEAAGEAQLAETERVDITEPGARPPEGHLHLMTQAIHQISDIFAKIGFVRTRYPEVDWDFYAFEALNMPADHPARDEWETYFMDAPVGKKGKMVLTPHTSNAQVRELERGEFPVRIINVAKTYRRQSDATHTPMFHQFEGLYVDENVSVTHLRGILDYFVKEFFGADRRVRLRPFHFRFTEPSFEIDISCGVCGGTGLGADGQKCKMCKRGWTELGGAGMVHPNVLKAAKVDPKKYAGLAFGFGVERTYLMREGMKIDDLRTLYKNDLRFLKQF